MSSLRSGQHSATPLWSALMLSVVLSGCSAQQNYRVLTINGSDAASTQHSIQQLVRYLPQEQKTDFLLALVRIQIQSGQQQPAALLQGAPDMKHVNYQFIGQHTHGMTYQQVLQLANSLGQ